LLVAATMALAAFFHGNQAIAAYWLAPFDPIF
jgi:hypothetical protein